MLLLKTDKARQELMPGVRTLSLRERSLLLLADAKPMQELQAMYHGEGSRIVDELMRAGYLRHPSPTASTNDEPPASQALPLPRSRVPLRSLAGTRMYLQDFWRQVCERLEPNQRAGRLKQWLNLLRRRYPEAEQAYQQVRTLTDQHAISLWLDALPGQGSA